MSRIVRTEKPSVLPLLAMGLVWLVLGLVLPLYRLWALAVTAAAGAAVYVAAKKVCPPQVTEHEVAYHTGVEDVDEMLLSMEQQLNTLHTINDAIPDEELSHSMSRMEAAGRAILEVVEAAPEKAKTVRRFANYYLPDAVKVLQQYATMARQGVKGENAATVKAEVETSAAQIATAFENQLDALYAAESMDLSADLDVLLCLMKGQGLG